jgi:hypothetical protein
MAHLNHMGPEEKGPKTGRKLGLCKKRPGETSDFEPGLGMGKKRYDEGFHHRGRGRRIQANKV